MPQSDCCVENSTGLIKSLTLTLLSSVFLFAGCGLQSKSDQETFTAQGVIGGEEASESDAVTRSTIRLAMIKNNFSYFLCSGVLISPDIVITAAHCYVLTGYPRTYVSLDRTLSGFDSQDPLTIAVESYRVHSLKEASGLFYPLTEINDVAILKLKRPVPDSFVPVPISNDPVHAGQRLVLAGYGVMDEEERLLSETLRYTEVNVDKTWESLLVTDQTEGRGGCRGDSGGPAYVTTADGLVLVGITRGSYNMSRSCNEYGEYTSVAHHLDFIKKSISEMGGMSPRFVDLK